MEGSDLNALLEIWDIDAKSCPNLLQYPELALTKRNELSNTSFHTSQQNTVSQCSLKSKESDLGICNESEAFHLQEDSASTDQFQLQQCQNCYIYNEHESNWCMNCGTAILVEKNNLSNFSDYNLKEIGILDLMQPIHTHLETQSLCSDSSDELESPLSIETFNTSLPTHTKISTHEQPKFQSSVLHRPNTPTRHWNTSSTYMWRKPSSINRKNCKSNFINCKHKNITKTIPHLDLSSLSLDSSSSTRDTENSAKNVSVSS